MAPLGKHFLFRWTNWGHEAEVREAPMLVRAADQEVTITFQDAKRFGHRVSVVWHVFEHVEHRDRIERFVGEGESRSIPAHEAYALLTIAGQVGERRIDIEVRNSSRRR